MRGASQLIELAASMEKDTNELRLRRIFTYVSCHFTKCPCSHVERKFVEVWWCGYFLKLFTLECGMLECEWVGSLWFVRQCGEPPRPSFIRGKYLPK